MRDVVTALEDGTRVELAREDGELELAIDGHVVATSRSPGVAETLAELAVGPWAGRDDVSVLLAGLGLGHTLRALLARPGVVRVDVVEVSPAVIASSPDGAGDPRVRVHQGELTAFAAGPRLPDEPADGWFVAVLDVDEYPTWVARPGNRALYTDEGIRLLEGALRPGGVLAIWTTERDDALQKRLHAKLQQVSRVTVPVDDGLRYVYRGRRAPRRAS
jgi:spermidine synthase